MGSLLYRLWYELNKEKTQILNKSVKILYRYFCPGIDYSLDSVNQDISDLYISGVQPVQGIHPVASVQPVARMESIKGIEPVSHVQQVTRKEEVKSIEPVVGIQEIRSMIPVTSKQEVGDIKEIISMQEIQKLIPLDSEKVKLFLKEEGLDGSNPLPKGYSGKPTNSLGSDYSDAPLPGIPGIPEVSSSKPPTRGYSGNPAPTNPQPSGEPSSGLLEPIERDIEKEDNINKLLEDEYTKGLTRLKGIELVKAKHKLARAEKIKKLDEVKRMLEVKSMEEVRRMNGIQSIEEVKSMEEVRSKKELIGKQEVKSKEEVISKVDFFLNIFIFFISVSNSICGLINNLTEFAADLFICFKLRKIDEIR